MQDLTQALQRVDCDPLVVLEVIDRPGIDAILGDEGIGRLLSIFHSFPQRRIADQDDTLSQRFDNLIIVEKWVLCYTEKCIYIMQSYRCDDWGK